MLGIARAEALLDAAARELGECLGVDGPALMRERAEILHIASQGTTSAGGTCRLMPARDGWIAMNQARKTGETPLVVDLSALWAGPL